MRIHLYSPIIFSRKVIAAMVAVCLFVLSVVPPGFAQTVAPMPVPGTIVHPSPVNDPLLLRGLRVYLDDPFRLDFIVDENRQGTEAEELRLDSLRSITYFLTALTIPRGDLWVNLSPFEQDRIVPDALGQTALGRDLLAQDYLLKQLTASFIHPDDILGKQFWDKVYREAYKRYGTTDIPLDTFHKVWVVPGSAGVYEDKDRVIVVENQLKVMLETDYLASQKVMSASPALPEGETAPKRSFGGLEADYLAQSKETEKRVASGQGPVASESEGLTTGRSPLSTQDISTQILREIIIPAIEREVNQGENFAVLRQIYQAIILANWYKERVEDAVLKDNYIDQRKLGGIDLNDPQAKQVIYRQYVEAFKKGVYEMIREENDPYTQEMIPRKYFSGGFSFDGPELKEIRRHSPENTSPAMISEWLKKFAARTGKNAKTILLSVLLVAYSAVASGAETTAANTGTGHSPTNALAGFQSAGDVDAMMKKLGEMSKKGNLSSDEIVGLLDLLRANGDKITGPIFDTIQKLIIDNRGKIFDDQKVLRAACATLLAVQDNVNPQIKPNVDYMAGVLERFAPDPFTEARRERDALQARMNGPQKLLSSLTGEPLKNFTEASQGNFRLWIDQLKASPTNAQFTPLFDFIGRSENLSLIDDLILNLPQTELEAQTLVSNILKRLTEKGILMWDQAGPDVWKSIWVKDTKGNVLWQCSPMVRGTAPSFMRLLQDNMWQGITLMVVSMGLVAAGLNLKPDGKVKSKALAAPKERGGELLPEVAQKFAELEAARKAAAQPRPSMLVDPRTFTDEQQVIDTVKALDGKVINNLRNEKTLDVTGRIRSGAVLAADDITNAKKYLVRRYAAQKGWQTRRQREAARKAALAVEQAAATFPQTIEQRQFVDSFAELTAGARQKLAEAPEASRPLWQGRLTALEQLRGFVLERYQSVPRQMILDDINLQDSPEEFLTRLMQKLVIPHYTYENNASVMDKPAIMDAKVENNNLILTSNGAVSVQPIVMPLSEDKETAALLEQFNKYSQTKGREDYFLYPALREGESLLPLEVRKNELHLEVLSMVPSQVLALPADKAMTPVGGIDMNDNLLNVKSAGAGPRIRLKFEVDADRAASFDGFIPKVLSIQPLDLQDFFKLSKASQV